MNTDIQHYQAGDIISWSAEPTGNRHVVTRATDQLFWVMWKGVEYEYRQGTGCQFLQSRPAPQKPPVAVTLVPFAEFLQATYDVFVDDASPQAKLVYGHLKRAGSITQREAISDHSVQSLTARISELRNKGISIRREFRYHPITMQRYARYSLVL